MFELSAFPPAVVRTSIRAQHIGHEKGSSVEKCNFHSATSTAYSFLGNTCEVKILATPLDDLEGRSLQNEVTAAGFPLYWCPRGSTNVTPKIYSSKICAPDAAPSPLSPAVSPTYGAFLYHGEIV